jgi:hypothetical protein
MLPGSQRAACNLAEVVCYRQGRLSQGGIYCAEEHGIRKWLVQAHHMAEMEISCMNPVRFVCRDKDGRKVHAASLKGVVQLEPGHARQLDVKNKAGMTPQFGFAE